VKLLLSGIHFEIRVVAAAVPWRYLEQHSADSWAAAACGHSSAGGAPLRV